MLLNIGKLPQTQTVYTVLVVTEEGAEKWQIIYPVTFSPMWMHTT